MLESGQNYLKQKADQLNLGRGDALGRIQAELERLYPGQARAVSLNHRVLKLATPSSSLASELRWSQGTMLQRFKELAAPTDIDSINIQIRSL